MYIKFFFPKHIIFIHTHIYIILVHTFFRRVVNTSSSEILNVRPVTPACPRARLFGTTRVCVLARPDALPFHEHREKNAFFTLLFLSCLALFQSPYLYHSLLLSLRYVSICLPSLALFSPFEPDRLAAAAAEEMMNRFGAPPLIHIGIVGIRLHTQTLFYT